MLIIDLSPVQAIDQDSFRIKMERMRQEADSMNRSLDSFNASMNAHMEKMLEEQRAEHMERFQEENIRSLNEFMARQREQDARKRKSLIIRGAGLVVLIGVWIFTFIKKRRQRVSRNEGGAESTP